MKNKETKLSKFLRRKISTKKLETSGVAALTFGDLIYAIKTSEEEVRPEPIKKYNIYGDEY